jgi:cytoskeletal protein RodZ
MAGVLAGFGDELRSERERRGVSLERMCAETKVNSRHLDALERGDYKALPGGVFRRGIVRAYLSSLGLEEREWMPRFEKSYASFANSTGQTIQPDEAWATFAANVKKDRGPARQRNTARWMGVLALFLLLVAAVWAVWHYLLLQKLVR